MKANEVFNSAVGSMVFDEQGGLSGNRRYQKKHGHQHTEDTFE
jgi:hypothetical protein